MPSENFKIGIGDSIVFVCVLLISAVNGVYFAYKDRRKKSTDVYFYGEKKMSPFPVGMSIAVSFISSVTIMAYPVEVYLYGSVWFWIVFSIPVVVAITAVYFIPIYYGLRLKSVYKYMEMRFNKTVRLLCSILTLLNMIGYMAVIVYIPALAITALTPVSIHWTITLTSLLCTFYTVSGGFKSVVWTDTFQSVIMLVGSLVLVIRATVVLGGVGEVYTAMERGNRTNFLTFEPNPLTRCTFWSIMFGNCVTWLFTTATNQADVQRYLSCSSLRDARMSTIYGLIPQTLITSLAIATGCLTYAYFEGCDPLANDEIDRNDQLVPLLVAKVLRDIPGATGLFVASVYCGTLSSVSSGINSMTAMVMEDFVPLRWPKMAETSRLHLSRLIGVLFGLLNLFLSFGISLVQGTVVQVSTTLFSAFGPVVLGMFILGIFVPWSTSKGALIGGSVGFLITSWLTVGSIFLSADYSQALTVETDSCDNGTYPEYLNFTVTQTATAPQLTSTIAMTPTLTGYDISFLWFKPIGFVVTMIVGVVASFVTGAQNPAEMDPRLFAPLIGSKVYPERVRNFFRFGVPKKICDKTDQIEKLEFIPITSA